MKQSYWSWRVVYVLKASFGPRANDGLGITLFTPFNIYP